MRIIPINNPAYMQPQERNHRDFVPLQLGAVSFRAMKKSQFQGIDRAVVEKFKAPIEKFNIHLDFQNWAKTRVEAITEANYGGRRQETLLMRKSILKEWFDYVINGNDAYSWATRLIILAGITDGLTKKDDRLPPTLSQGVLADTVFTLDSELNADSKRPFNFDKMYRNNLQSFYLSGDTNTGTEITEWVSIPSKIKDPINFEKNVEKLKTLSCKTWCTKSYNAQPYLSQGDFHIYLENGQPKLGVRFVGDKIEEIQGELNNSQIPLDYFDIFESYRKENDFQLHSKAEAEVNAVTKAKCAVEKIKTDLSEAIAAKDVIKIFNYFGIETSKDKNGMLIISEYKQPKECSYAYLGIDESDLIKNVVKISGNADFKGSNIKTLENLESIGGNASFENARITDLGKLKSIGGNVDFKSSNMLSLGNLESIGKDARFKGSQINDLGNLKSIGGRGDFFGCLQLTNIGKLEFIGGNAYFEGSQITSLGNLETIGGDVDFVYSQITDLGKLKSIGGSAYFSSSQIKSLNNLESIGENANFEGSQVTNLCNLKSIGKDAKFRNSKLTSLGNIESIGGNVTIEHSQITDLGCLKSIGGNVSFKDTQITSLKGLKSIGGYAGFREAKITSLGNLETIGGTAYFGGSDVTDLGKLESIGGNATFGVSQISNLGNLKTIGGNADFGGCKITSLGNLETIHGNAILGFSQIFDIGKLKTIGKNADFEGCQITHLGNLKSIGGNADFGSCKVTSLGDLETIGGYANFENSKITSLGKLKSIGSKAVEKNIISKA